MTFVPAFVNARLRFTVQFMTPSGTVVAAPEGQYLCQFYREKGGLPVFEFSTANGRITLLNGSLLFDCDMAEIAGLQARTYLWHLSRVGQPNEWYASGDLRIDQVGGIASRFRVFEAFNGAMPKITCPLLDGEPDQIRKNEQELKERLNDLNVLAERVNNLSALKARVGDLTATVDQVETSLPQLNTLQAAAETNPISLCRYASRPELARMNVPITVPTVQVDGYYEAGDGGGGLLKRVSNAGVGITRSADGAYWGVASSKPTVKEYGAKGDGVTEDSFIINAAIVASKYLYFPDGTYAINGALDLVVPANCPNRCLEFSTGALLKKINVGGNGIFVHSWWNRFIGIKIDGSRTSAWDNVNDRGVYGAAMIVNGSYNIIEYANVWACGNGIMLGIAEGQKSVGNKVINSKVDNMTAVGISQFNHLEGEIISNVISRTGLEAITTDVGSHRTKVHFNNIFSPCGRGGVGATGCDRGDYVSLIGNYVENCSNNGIGIACHSGHSNHVIIAFNRFVNVAGEVINIENWKGPDIGWGVGPYYAYDTIIIGNTVKGGGTGPAIKIYPGSLRTIVSSNSLDGRALIDEGQGTIFNGQEIGDGLMRTGNANLRSSRIGGQGWLLEVIGSGNSSGFWTPSNNNAQMALRSGTGSLDVVITSGGSPSFIKGPLSFFPANSASPGSNGELTFEASSDTAIKIKLRGKDGVVRGATLNLNPMP